MSKDYPHDYRSAGFVWPRYTPTPDDLFDYHLSRLSESQLKVLMYIIRHTLGFKKQADAISLSQLQDGIAGQDEGTGLSRPAIINAVAFLEDIGLIEVERRADDKGGKLPNIFRLRLQSVDGEGVVNPDNHPGKNNDAGVVNEVYPQKIDSPRKDSVLASRWQTLCVRAGGGPRHPAGLSVTEALSDLLDEFPADVVSAGLDRADESDKPIFAPYKWLRQVCTNILAERREDAAQRDDAGLAVHNQLFGGSDEPAN